MLLISLLFVLLATIRTADFELSESNSLRILKVGSQHFCLYPRDQPELANNCSSEAYRVGVPVRRFISLSSTHLPMIESLNLQSRLVGVSNASHFRSRDLLDRLRRNQIRQVGLDYQLNLEQVLLLKPEVLFYYAPVQEAPALDKLRKLGIVLVPINEYLSAHPLDAVEWIRVMAVFFGKEELAMEQVIRVRQAYQNLLADVPELSDTSPTVLINAAYSGQWYVPGKDSYMARLIRDAGGKYLFDDMGDKGSVTLPWETVLMRAKDADVWLMTATCRTTKELLQMDSRHALITALKRKRVYNSNLNPDWFVTALANPHLILQDLIGILHDRSLPRTYYQPLQD